MEAMNPYAPPKAAVADVAAEAHGVQPVKLWSAQGRVGRLRYLAHLMAAYIAAVAGGFLAGLVGGAIGSDAMVNVSAGVVAVAYVLFVVLKSIQRSHDMDWSGWSALLALIPLVGLLWIFKGGTPGGNRFGAPPPPNTLGVKILALFVPAIGIIGIIAAIALPAYQGYAQRAKTVQVR